MPELKQDLEIIEKKPSEEEKHHFPTEIKMDDAKEKEIAKMVYDEIVKAEDDMGNLPNEKKAWVNLYEGNVEAKDFPWRNCANVPASSAIVAAIVEGYHDRTMAALFGGHYVWIGRALPGTDPDKAELGQDYLHHVQSIDMKLEESHDDAFLDFYKTGNLTGILEWSYKTEKVRDVEHYETAEELIKENGKPIEDKVEDGYYEIKSPILRVGTGVQLQKEYGPYFTKLIKGEPQDIQVEYNRVIENHPKLEFIDWDDFFVSGGADAHKDLSRARMTGHKLSLRWDDLKRRARIDEDGDKTDNPFGIYFNLDKLKEAYSKGAEKSDKHKKVTEGYRIRDYDIRQTLFRYDVDDDGYEELCLLSIEWEQQILVRADLYDYWHNRVNYIPYRFIPKQVNKLFCLGGIPKMLIDLADEYDKQTNQQLDNNTLANTVQFEGIRGSSAEEEFESRQFYPGVTYWFESFDEIKQMEIRFNALDTLPFKQELKGLMELRSGYSQYFSGQTPASDPKAPASKTAMLMKEALMKVEDGIKRLRRGPMKELAYQIWQLSYQYGGDKEIGITERTGALKARKVSRQDMQRFGIDFIPIGTSSKINRELDKMLDLQLVETIKNNPEIFGPILQNPQATRELAESVIRNWGADWASKLDKLLPTEQQIREDQIRIQMEAMRRMEAEQQFIEQRRAEGATDEVIEAELEQMRVAQAQGEEQQTQGVTT